MIDIEKMVSSLKLATNKSVAEAHQGKVVNKNRLYIFIGTALFCSLYYIY